MAQLGAAVVGSPNSGPLYGTQGTTFSIGTARQMLFRRLPPELQTQTAFRHFYTDDLDPHSSEMSLRFFGLCIAYFCSLCRLEGRRRHYLQSPSEKAGTSFSRAHARTQYVFQRLNGAYGAILLRYNCHSELSLPVRGMSIAHRNRLHPERAAHIVGAKSLGPAVKRVKAFEYVADELRFYEELFVFTEQILRLAFVDERLQNPVGDEVNAMFRGAQFNFGQLRREQVLRNAAQSMDGLSNPVLHNNRLLAESLVPRAPKVVVKEAAVQCTPLIANRMPTAKTAARLYQRPGSALDHATRAAAKARKNNTEATFTDGGGNNGSKSLTLANLGNTSTRVGMNPFDLGRGVVQANPIAFPATHRAVAGFLAKHREAKREQRKHLQTIGAALDATMPSPSPNASAQQLSTGTTSNPLQSRGSPARGSLRPSRDAAANRQQQHTSIAHSFLPKLQDFDVVDPAGAATPDAGLSGATSINSPDQLSMSTASPPPKDLAGGPFSASPPAALRGASPTTASLKAIPARGGRRDDDDEDSLRNVAAMDVAQQDVSRRRSQSVRFKPGRRRSQAPTAAPAGGDRLDDLRVVAPVNPVTGKEEWKSYNPLPDIDRVYQLLANGVTISDLSIPPDIRCTYDDTGILLESGMET